MTQLVIFDLDGTLVDTLLDITAGVNWAMSNLQLPQLAPEQVKEHIGQGASQLLAGCLRDVGDIQATHLAEARALFFPYYAEHIADHTRPYPGVVETLHALQTMGLTLAICSNKPIDMTEQLLQQLRLRSLFRIVLGGDSLPERKPHPLPLQHIMRECSFSPEQTIMVGDMIFDIQSGRQAGVWTCGISYDSKHKAQLLAAGADSMISSFPEVLQIV